ncbi:hypothetical protein SLA2020_068090 [Shorea laevis]
MENQRMDCRIFIFFSQRASSSSLLLLSSCSANLTDCSNKKLKRSSLRLDLRRLLLFGGGGVGDSKPVFLAIDFTGKFSSQSINRDSPVTARWSVKPGEKTERSGESNGYKRTTVTAIIR